MVAFVNCPMFAVGCLSKASGAETKIRIEREESRNNDGVICEQKTSCCLTLGPDVDRGKQRTLG